MNSRRGLFRFWLIASALWVLFWLARIDPFCIYSSEDWCEQISDVPFDMWLPLAGMVFGTSVAFLVFGWLIMWVIAGIGSRRPN
jgi:hypothetical protein